MLPAAEWYPRATSRWQDWDQRRLAAAKGAARVSVVIPARDEAETIGGIVAEIRRLAVPGGLVDELVVIDSDSTDDTAAIAAAAGAQVHAAREVRPDLGAHSGKGEALWKSLFVTTGDILVFIDADLTEWGPHFVTGLLGPLLTNPQTQLVKGFYDRILDDGSAAQSVEGGRVTELVARPLLNLAWPELSHVVQPLAGEWAIRRAAFASLPVPIGYGVELATLIDVRQRHGLDAIAQVDLGVRAHSHQSVHQLAVMAAELLAVAARRASGTASGTASSGGAAGSSAVRAATPSAAGELWQFSRDRDPAWRARVVPLAERPPHSEASG